MLTFEVTGTGASSVRYSLTGAPAASGGRAIEETHAQPTLPWTATTSVTAADLPTAHAGLAVTPASNAQLMLRILLGDRVLGATYGTGPQELVLTVSLT
jgi:hypothetical protein